MFKTTLFGGYETKGCLALVDMMNKRIEELDVLVKEKKAGREYSTPTPFFPPALKTSIFGGFEKNFMDSYIRELKNKVLQLESQLTK